MKLGWSYYARLGGVSFAVGAAMEAFMNATGFYEKVAQLEAERMRAEKEAAEAAMEKISATRRKLEEEEEKRQIQERKRTRSRWLW